MKGGKGRESDRAKSEKCVREEKCMCKVMEDFKETENVTSRLILCEDLVSTGPKALQTPALAVSYITSLHVKQ